jgi:hypothetical protein
VLGTPPGRAAPPARAGQAAALDLRDPAAFISTDPAGRIVGALEHTVAGTPCRPTRSSFLRPRCSFFRILVHSTPSSESSMPKPPRRAAHPRHGALPQDPVVVLLAARVQPVLTNRAAPQRPAQLAAAPGAECADASRLSWSPSRTYTCFASALPRCICHAGRSGAWVTPALAAITSRAAMSLRPPAAACFMLLHASSPLELHSQTPTPYTLRTADADAAECSSEPRASAGRTSISRRRGKIFVRIPRRQEVLAYI